jgi:hypothetical protein
MCIFLLGKKTYSLRGDMEQQGPNKNIRNAATSQQNYKILLYK